MVGGDWEGEGEEAMKEEPPPARAKLAAPKPPVKRTSDKTTSTWILASDDSSDGAIAPPPPAQTPPPKPPPPLPTKATPTFNTNFGGGGAGDDSLVGTKVHVPVACHFLWPLPTFLASCPQHDLVWPTRCNQFIGAVVFDILTYILCNVESHLQGCGYAQ